MGWNKTWDTHEDGTQSNVKEVPADKSQSGNPETHYINTAGGGSKKDHSHVIVQHREGRDTAHSVPRGSMRKK